MDRRGWSHRQLAEHLHIAHGTVTRAVALLDLPADVQGRVEGGRALPVGRLPGFRRSKTPTPRRAVADRIVSEGLKRDEVVEVVRQATGRGAKGRGVAKARPKLPTERMVRTAGGLKVTVSGRKGFDVLAWLEAMEDATRQVRAKLEAVEGQDAA